MLSQGGHNLENLEYLGISLNMENSEFRAAWGKNCNKLLFVRYSYICLKQLLTG